MEQQLRSQVATLCAATLLWAAVPGSGWTYEARWSTDGRNEDVVAVGCRDCEEDLGIIIACKGRGKPAEVTVNAAASGSGTDGVEAPVTFTIDGDSFTRTAQTLDFGMIGFTPVVSMAPDDLIVPAMQSGRSAWRPDTS
jgi:hypothetical protein